MNFESYTRLFNFVLFLFMMFFYTEFVVFAFASISIEYRLTGYIVDVIVWNSFFILSVFSAVYYIVSNWINDCIDHCEEK